MKRCKEEKREEAVARQEVYNSLTDEEKKNRLEGFTAKKERARKGF